MDRDTCDLYFILEIGRDATESEIKRAYRKQAIKWHPDKNPGNAEEAETRFKLVAEAYEILSDPQKKSLYDRYGMEALRGEGSGSHAGAGHGAGAGGFYVDPFELFRTFFNGNDPFSDAFGGDPFFGGGGFTRSPAGSSAFSSSSSVHTQGPGGMSMFGGDMMNGMGGMGMGMGMGGFDGMFQSMMGGGGMQMGSMQQMGGGGGFSKSTSSSTVIQNGRRVTRTTTTIRHPDGRVETSTDEQVEEGGGGGSGFLNW